MLFRTLHFFLAWCVETCILQNANPLDGGLRRTLLRRTRRRKLGTLSLPDHLQPQALPKAKKGLAKLTLWPLVAATFFMVSGGAYGTEDIVHGAGYGLAILILLLTPVLWGLPTAFMIGELASALPAAEASPYLSW